MNEPRRWLDGGGGAPEGARELLEHATRSRAADRVALAASAAALAKLGAAPAVAAAAGLSLSAKLAASVAVVAVAGVTTLQVVRTEPAETMARGAQPAKIWIAKPAPAVAPREARAASEPAPPVLAPPPVAAPPPVLESQALLRAATPPARLARSRAQAARVPDVAPAPEVPVQAPAPPPEAPALAGASEPEPLPVKAPSETPEPDALAAEVRWLEQARALLARDPNAALRHASEHRARFPDGALVAERELIAVEALQRMGRQVEAQRRGQALLRRSPGSLYRERLKSLFE